MKKAGRVCFPVILGERSGFPRYPGRPAWKSTTAPPGTLPEMAHWRGDNGGVEVPFHIFPTRG